MWAAGQMLICLSHPASVLTNLCGVPSRTTKICPAVASSVSSPRVKRTFPSRTTNDSSYRCQCRSGPVPALLRLIKERDACPALVAVEPEGNLTAREPVDVDHVVAPPRVAAYT